jgi:hypothetical protein
LESTSQEKFKNRVAFSWGWEDMTVIWGRHAWVPCPLCYPAESKGRKNTCLPSLTSFSSPDSEFWFSSKSCQSHPIVHTGVQSAQHYCSLKTRAFYLHTTSHDNTQLLSSSFASPTLTLLHLVLSRCGQSNEQNVLEPGTRGLSSLDVSIRKTSEDGLGAQRIRHRIFLSREKKISLRIGERIR